ncbi:MAG TPA: hypothetical protein VFC65_00020 [Prolixibacteraceae bacterium]|nr:hypothetical protein [Prolixibacteraceae bacterium]
MEEALLRQKYREIEDRIVPIVDFLEFKKDFNEYKGLYKGIITLQSPLVFKPEILFIGINSGPGAYNELNQNNSSNNKTPLRMIGKDKMCFNELNWFQYGNAMGGINERGNWEKFHWYQRNKKINNPFTRNMIDILYEIARLKFSEEYKKNNYDNNKLPFWYEDFGKSIMCTNLYPIATTDVTDLNKIHSTLAHEKELQKFWEESRGNDKHINEWVIRKYFLKRVDELIHLVQPKVIVFMGISAFNDFMGRYRRHGKDKGPIQTDILTLGDNKIPIIGFKRAWGWNSRSRISKIAAKINEESAISTSNDAKELPLNRNL